MRKDVHVDVAFWYLFIATSLKPAIHSSEIFKEASQLLNAIRKGWYFDAAKFIWKKIRGSGRQHDNTNVIFPSLITAMCATAGLAIDTPRDYKFEPETPLILVT